MSLSRLEKRKYLPKPLKETQCLELLLKMQNIEKRIRKRISCKELDVLNFLQ